MFRSAFITTTERASETLGSVAILVVSESIFIYLVHRIGPIPVAGMFSLFYGTLCFLLFRLFRRAATAQTKVGRIVRAIITHAEKLKVRYQKLIASSELFAVLVVSLLAGCFVTTVFIGLLGYRGQRAYVLIASQTIVSVTFWAFLYSGALRLVFHH